MDMCEKKNKKFDFDENQQLVINLGKLFRL